ncbi:MAG: homoserine O-acetyltransferase, partial [Epsilonproteobacteria bacterium]|nr:homoserine O-acetyltransferase [Campylobacterota bacterium]
RNYVETDGLYELYGRFQVERYLDYNGYNFTSWFDPLSYLYITKAINIFDISRNYDSLEEALDRVRNELYLISFKSDLLFLPSEMEKIYDTMKAIGKENLCSYRCIDSDYGHDAFLVEIDKFEDYIRDILER